MGTKFMDTAIVWVNVGRYDDADNVAMVDGASFNSSITRLQILGSGPLFQNWKALHHRVPVYGFLSMYDYGVHLHTR